MPPRDCHSLPLIDHEEALRRCGHREAIAAELFEQLRASLPSAESALRAAHENSDPDRLRDAAHRLLGAALYCGVPRLQEQARAVEDSARHGDWAALSPAVTDLIATMVALQASSMDTPGADSSAQGP